MKSGVNTVQRRLRHVKGRPSGGKYRFSYKLNESDGEFCYYLFIQ